jgi:prolipoprotein diacylglyceryltransferase
MIEGTAMLVGGTESGEWARKIAELYMNWYTFFVTANILLLGWFYSKDSKDQKPPKPAGYIFLMLNLFGAITSNLVGYFLSHEAGRFGFLMIWAGATNSVGLLGIAFLWVHTVRTR